MVAPLPTLQKYIRLRVSGLRVSQLRAVDPRPPASFPLRRRRAPNFPASAANVSGGPARAARTPKASEGGPDVSVGPAPYGCAGRLLAAMKRRGPYSRCRPAPPALPRIRPRRGAPLGPCDAASAENEPAGRRPEAREGRGGGGGEGGGGVWQLAALCAYLRFSKAHLRRASRLDPPLPAFPNPAPSRPHKPAALRQRHRRRRGQGQRGARGPDNDVCLRRAAGPQRNRRGRSERLPQCIPRCVSRPLTRALSESGERSDDRTGPGGPGRTRLGFAATAAKAAPKGNSLCSSDASVA